MITAGRKSSRGLSWGVQLPRSGTDEGGRDAPLVELTAEQSEHNQRLME